MARWTFSLSSPAFPLTLLDTLGRVVYLIAVGLVVLLPVVFQFVRARELYGESDAAPQEERTNCPSCGARTSVGSETCEYCDEPIHR